MAIISNDLKLHVSFKIWWKRALTLKLNLFSVYGLICFFLSPRCLLTVNFCQHESHQWGKDPPQCDSHYHLNPLLNPSHYHKLTIREHFGFSASTKPLWRWSTSDKVRPPTIFNTWQLTSKEIWQICPAWQKELGDDWSPPGNSHTGLNPLCNFLWHHFEHRMKSNILKQRALARHPARLMWLRLSVKSRKPAPNAIMHVYWA